MITVKPGVQPPMLWIAAGVARVATALGRPITITSGIDGKHSPRSLHYSLRALDIRSYDLPDVHRVVEMLKHELGSDYDVVHEVDHIHIEFDPKR